jgi:hypothetical protein
VLVATFIPPNNLAGLSFGSEVTIANGNTLWIGVPDFFQNGPGEVYFVNLDEATAALVPMSSPAGSAILLVLLAATGSGFALWKRSRA